MKFRVFISGKPGVGKTTLFLKLVDYLRERGLKVGGIICPEIREGRVRVGFKIIDISTRREGYLAKVQEFCEGPRVGKYCVIVEDAVRIGVVALTNAMSSADVVAIAEIGPMELKVRELRDVINFVLRGSKPLIAVIHRRLYDDYRVRYGRDPDTYLTFLTERNRSAEYLNITRFIDHFIK